jgi:V/A-type H+-transporting ATPase subunit C
MARKVSNLEYAYAVGKIRVLERFLIKGEVFEEAVGASLPEALRLFVEADLYGEELLQVRSSAQLEEVLGRELEALKKQVGGLLLEEPLRGLLDAQTPEGLQRFAAASGNRFLNDYVSYVIDMHNIRTFARLGLLGEPREKLAERITCEGFIGRGDLLDCYGKELPVLLNRLEYVHIHGRVFDYAAALKEGIEKAYSAGSFVSLEQAINSFLVGQLRAARYISFGPEPLVAYYFAKVNEMNLIRLIVLAKINNVAAGLVQERLNGVYA